MAILITGAGMIGCHAAQWLVDHGEQISLLDIAPVEDYVRRVVNLSAVQVLRGDVRRLEDVLSAVRESGAERIVHTAAVVGPGLEKHPFAGASVNVLGTLNVLEGARLLGLKAVVLCSSQSVYDLKVPCMHTFMTEEHPVDATGLYAATKLASESLGLTYHRTYGLHFVALRFATVYGPRFGVGESRIGQLWNDLVQRSLCGQDVRLDVPAFLSQPNDYVYVKDVAQALGHAVLSDTVAHRLFNIGSGDLSRVSDLVRIVSELIPHSCITVHEASDAVRDWPVRRPYDMKRSRDELQYVPQFDLRRGLTDQLSVTRHQLGLDDSVSD